MRGFIKTAVVAVIGLLLMISAVGCGQTKAKNEGGERTKTPAATKDWKTVKSADGSLSFKVPQDWQAKTVEELKLGKGKLFAVFGPKDGDYTTNVQASVESIGGLSLSNYISEFEKNTQNDPSTKEFKTIEEGPEKSRFGKAYRKKYNHVLQTRGRIFKLKFDVYYLNKGNDYYVIQLVTTENLYPRLSRTFDNVLSTLVIK